ncbi:hypothetical protein ANRL1_04030 [Anaerolineae bacterium]|nr:hypothetical protein ANRL1_04030 [Anaerolineae bacterium]
MTSENFYAHYWRAFLWIALAVYTLFAATVTFILYAVNHQWDSNAITLLLIGACFAIARFFINGGRFQSESRSRDGLDRAAENVIIWVIQAVIYTLVWPFIEIFAQIRFLSRARSGWSRGEILVNEKNGRPLRAA